MLLYLLLPLPLSNILYGWSYDSFLSISKVKLFKYLLCGEIEHIECKYVEEEWT